MAARLTLFALWLILVYFSSNLANGNLTVHPTDTVVLVNQWTYFNCSTSFRNVGANYVLWYHYPLNSATRNDVYDEGNIMFEYKERFRIETNLTEGVFNLVVEKPSLADAGRYECQDGVGQGDKASAELIVLDGYPSCESNMNPDGVIGQNDCGLEPDEMQLTCNVTSYGNIRPTLEWKISGDKSGSSLVVCESSTSCSLTVKGNLTFNNQSLVCQTTKAKGQQYGCSIGPVKVKYALNSSVKLATEGVVKCFIDASQPCSYKWYNAKNETVSSDEILHTTVPGQYKCEAQCKMNRQIASCRLTAMEVEVVSRNHTSSISLSSKAVPPTVVVHGLVPMPVLEPTVASPQKPVPDALWAIVSVPIICAISLTLTSFHLYKQHKCRNVFKRPGPANSQLELSSLPIITDQDMVDTLTINQYFIDRGTSATIYGPFRWNDKKCALKQILFSRDELTKELEENILQKANRCKKLDHPHLVKVFEVWFPSPALYILMEYAEGKSLDKILRPIDGLDPLPPFSLEIIQNWALQIADGMKYLHYNDLVHRNLMAAHVLVMESPDVLPNTLKIGSYMPIKQHDHATVMSVKGPMAWMAPEYIRNEQFSKLSDVWSYGVTVWEILTRDVPYKEGKKETEIVNAAVNKTLKLKAPDSCPKPLQDVLTKCWNHEVDQRLSFTEICDHLRLPRIWVQ